MLPGPEPVPLPFAGDWSTLKDVVKRFEHDWHQPPRPTIDDYLRAGDPIRFRVLVELVHIDLELRLKAGEHARVEEYLARFPELSDDSAVTLDLIAAEHDLRRRRERDLSLDEYLNRFPQYRAALPIQLVQTKISGRHTMQVQSSTTYQAPPPVEGYEILSLIGRGGMAVVYKARHNNLDRFVALKFLPDECARDPIWLARFRREARTASALNHPNICTIYDIGESAGRPFLSMEFVEGQTIEGLIARRLPVEELAQLLVQAARALAAAHAAGVIHRDIKPANLMVRDDGILKVLDFGLARRIAASGVKSLTSSEIGTDPGTRVGTLLYMSPEQVRAEPVDSATDIFSLGLVLYELATGQHPFRADSDIGLVHAIVAQTPIPPMRRNPEVPASLEGLIHHMLAKDPCLRPTAPEVEARLTQPGHKNSWENWQQAARYRETPDRRPP